MNISKVSFIIALCIATFSVNTSTAGGGGGGGVAINWIVAFAGIAHGGNDGKEWIVHTESDGMIIMGVWQLGEMLKHTSIVRKDDDGNELSHHLTPEERSKAKQMYQATKKFSTSTNYYGIENFKAFVYTTTGTEEQNTLYSDMHAKLYGIHTENQEN
ncbi:MAG: hypothetical protein AAGB35_10010 [Pseudomonadota bacterium]